LAELVVAHIQTPQAVTECPEIEIFGPLGQLLGFHVVLVGDVSGVRLDEGVAVFGETLAGRREKSHMAGCRGKNAFHEFQAEWNGLADEFGVIVRGEGVAFPGQAVRYRIDGDGFDEASIKQECTREKKKEKT